jgi:DNA replicative helicase MCM subunit Mcm2 (Cdc46/Mcm family)
MTYGVIVCTKCRQHAQIIEIGTSKTTNCQKCNAKLQTRKLRVFFSSDILEEAVSVRTQIQAQIDESGNTPTMKHKGIGSGLQNFQIFGNEIDEKSACLIDNRKTQKKKKKADEVIINILMENNDQMGIEELKEKTLKMDVGEEEFEEIIKKLKDAGELYSPSNDVIRIV